MNALPFRSALLSGLIVAIVGLGAVQPARAEIDPFYLSRLRDGEQALARGDYSQAMQQLRVAAFGMLDTPPQLAATLTELAIAQTGAGDNDAFRETLQRLQDLQDRFSAYSKAPLTDAQRENFETTVMQRLSQKELGGYEIFAHLVEQKIEQELALLPVRQRRRALQQRMKDHPDQPRWGLELAQLESTDGHPKAAIEALDMVLSDHPDLEEAHCQRGNMQVAQKNWSQAVEDLSVCTKSAADPELADQLLKALIAEGRNSDALAFADTLDESVAADPQVASTLASLQTTEQDSAQVENGSALPAEDSGTQPDESAAPGNESPGTSGESTATALSVSMKEQSSLDSARMLLQSRNASDIQRALDLVEPIATDHPEDRDVQLLAAEIAYRLSKWDEAIGYFQKAGGPRETQYALRFYYAVSLFEAGQREDAARELKRCLPHLQRTPFVEGYRERILGAVGTD